MPLKDVRCLAFKNNTLFTNYLLGRPSSINFLRRSNHSHRPACQASTWSSMHSACHGFNYFHYATPPFCIAYRQPLKMSLHPYQLYRLNFSRYFSSTSITRAPSSLLKQMQKYYARAPPSIRFATNVAIGAMGIATVLFASPFVLGLFAFAAWRVHRQLKRQQIPFLPWKDVQQLFRMPGGLNAAAYTCTEPMLQTLELQVKDQLRRWLQTQQQRSYNITGNLTPIEWVNSLIVTDTGYSLSSSSTTFNGYGSAPQLIVKARLTVELKALNSPRSKVVAQALLDNDESHLTIQSIRVSTARAGEVEVPLTNQSAKKQQGQQSRVFEGEFRDV